MVNAGIKSATFLLAFNFSIGLSFAVAFLALTRRSELRLGRWCAAGFLSAASTVTIEALASEIPSVRLTSAASFGSLMLALALITAGLAQHYRPQFPLVWLSAPPIVATVFNAVVVFELPRGSWGWALGYQGPFALMLVIATILVAMTSPRRPIDLALATVLGLSAIQFMTKAVLAGLAGGGPGVRDYIISAYAFYSQTAGGILSLLLGLVLIGLVVTEVMAETKCRLQRDSLSGILNRAAFIEQALSVLRKASAVPAALILADLDHFKSINDRFGHAAGDEVIRTFGSNLRAYFQDDALYGRLGGEEFCILVPGCSPAAARIHLEALQWLSRESRYNLLPPDVPVTASFGIALTDRDEPLEEALQRADMALYEAKTAGRDGYRFAVMRGCQGANDGNPFRVRSAHGEATQPGVSPDTRENRLA